MEINLPPVPDPALFTVLGFVLIALGCSSLLAGWAEGRLSWIGLLVIALGLVAFAWIHTTIGLTPIMIPEAFVEIAARILR